jgi:hypothetical protein
MILTGTMVVNALYFNQVQCALLWYTPFGKNMTVIAVKYVLQTGLDCSQLA